MIWETDDVIKINAFLSLGLYDVFKENGEDVSNEYCKAQTDIP